MRLINVNSLIIVILFVAAIVAVLADAKRQRHRKQGFRVSRAEAWISEGAKSGEFLLGFHASCGEYTDALAAKIDPKTENSQYGVGQAGNGFYVARNADTASLYGENTLNHPNHLSCSFTKAFCAIYVNQAAWESCRKAILPANFPSIGTDPAGHISVINAWNDNNPTVTTLDWNLVAPVVIFGDELVLRKHHATELSLRAVCKKVGGGATVSHPSPTWPSA